jgi:xanthine/uracil permease
VTTVARQGAAALSSGVIASTASWVAKGLLFLAAIGFAAGSFHPPETSGGHQTAIWIIIGAVLAAGIAATLITWIPRLRRLFPPNWGWVTLAWMRRREYA